jgi:hypothetical protein
MYGAIIVNHLSLTLTKLSVLFLFLDVFVIGWIRKATYAIMIFWAFSGLWAVLSAVFFCVPIHAFWEPALRGRSCIPTPAKAFTDASLNLAFDLVMLFLPLPVIWPMTLPWRHTRWFYFVFTLGLL